MKPFVVSSHVFTRISSISLGLFLIFSILACQNNRQEQNNHSSSEEPDSNKVLSLQQQWDTLSDGNLTDWKQYYQQYDSSFHLAHFQAGDSIHINPMKATAKASYDPDFNPIYTSFLIYAPSKNKYIDIDSYFWFPDEKGEPAFEADQEVSLVDLEQKSSTRISFSGPSERIEQVTWLNEQEVLLLGINYEKQPYIQHLNLKTNHGRLYHYPSSIPGTHDYLLNRIHEGLDNAK
ncbi:hypothetical protein [Sphingobacterium humi]|uniref:Uncharacterized protein n=1 Tax=Sphingobacterium humi TaxID=1796905 RepID=A0A6N8KTU5_9SPHI|nr:hypothetical protein [Sphingobacterium humi]MVZ60870.1 hypothetical protein [Sphingobacterium humi]